MGELRAKPEFLPLLLMGNSQRVEHPFAISNTTGLTVLYALLPRFLAKTGEVI